jgi:hypothetical protein
MDSLAFLLLPRSQNIMPDFFLLGSNLVCFFPNRLILIFNWQLESIDSPNGQIMQFNYFKTANGECSLFYLFSLWHFFRNFVPLHGLVKITSNQPLKCALNILQINSGLYGRFLVLFHQAFTGLFYLLVQASKTKGRLCIGAM